MPLARGRVAQPSAIAADFSLRSKTPQRCRLVIGRGTPRAPVRREEGSNYRCPAPYKARPGAGKGEARRGKQRGSCSGIAYATAGTARRGPVQGQQPYGKKKSLSTAAGGLHPDGDPKPTWTIKQSHGRELSKSMAQRGSGGKYRLLPAGRGWSQAPIRSTSFARSRARRATITSIPSFDRRRSADSTGG